MVKATAEISSEAVQDESGSVIHRHNEVSVTTYGVPIDGFVVSDIYTRTPFADWRWMILQLVYVSYSTINHVKECEWRAIFQEFGGNTTFFDAVASWNEIYKREGDHFILVSRMDELGKYWKVIREHNLRNLAERETA